MKSVVSSLVVDRARMAQNIARTGDLVYSEAVYVLIALGGDPEAHERIRTATLRAEKTGARLAEVLREEPATWEQLSRQLQATRGTDAASFFSDPASYTGLAAERARAIADIHDRRIAALRAELAR